MDDAESVFHYEKLINEIYDIGKEFDQPIGYHIVDWLRERLTKLKQLEISETPEPNLWDKYIRET